MKRKLLAIVLIAVMLVSMLPPLSVFAAFNDIAGHWAAGTIEKWSNAGVLHGYSDGSFKPSNPIKRGEFFKVIDSIMAYQTAGENRFSDLKKSDWYYEITLRLAAAGIVKGDAGSNKVRGESNIRREEAFVILSRVFNIKPDPGGLGLFKDAAAVSEWAKAGVGGMAAAGYIQGFDGFLRPQDPINRAEVITVIDNLIDMFIHQAGTYSGDGDIVVVNTPGVILDGAKFKDLYVTQGVGTGDFTLVNSTVTGTMYVNGGGVDSIKIIGANVNNLVIHVDPSTGDIRVSVSGNSNVTVVNINDGSDDVILEGTFTHVVVGGSTRVTLAEGTTAGSIKAIGDKADIVVNGKVTSIAVDADNVKIRGTGNVSTVSVESGTGNSVTVSGARVVVAEGAGQVSIGDGKFVQPGTEGRVSAPAEDDIKPPDGTIALPPGTYPPFTNPYEICKIDEIELIDDLPGVDPRTFGGNTQLRITGKTPGSFYAYVTVNDPEPAPDPDFDRDLLAVPELADLMLNPSVKGAVWGSYDEYMKTAEKDANWSSGRMQELNGLDALDNLLIIGFRATDGSTLAAPAGIEGYGGGPVSTPEELTKDGSWLAVSDGDLLFVVLYPEPVFEDPPELVATGSSRIYAWPPDIAYDPSLDDQGIIPGTYVYACFELDESYNFVGVWDPPTDIAGYTKVESPAEMGPKTWCVLNFTLSGTDYSYVLVRGRELFPVNKVTKVAIGAPRNLEFAARNAITLEVGKSLNLTALLSATGSLPAENREVTWKIANIYESAPAAEFTTKIRVNVVSAAPFEAKPSLKVIDEGIRSWSENPVEGEVYLGFSSDVHFDRNATSGENLFKLWMEKLSEKVGQIDYLTLAGDHTSAYTSDIEGSWANIKALAEIADEFKAKGFVKNDTLFILGNHECWETAGAAIQTVKDNPDEYPHLQEIVARMYEAGEDPIEPPHYIIIPFGAEYTDPEEVDWYGAEYGAAQMFFEDKIAALDEYLGKQAKDIPVFIVAHYPIHTYTAPEGGDRETGNSLKLINVLNKYPNVIFLWGHNHSSADPMYDKVYGPGDFIAIGPGVFGETIRINFTYAGAGCMSDFEYRSSKSSTSLPGGIYVKGKGMLVGISGSTVRIMWYDRPEKEWPSFMPAELSELAAAAAEQKVWYGAGAYRLNEEITESGWLHEDMYGSSSKWANNGTVLGGGASVVIFGFKGTGLDTIAGSITDLAGYAQVTSPSNMGPGRWGIVTGEDGTMVFVLLYTVSDENIWMPKYIGNAQVLSLIDKTITLWDGVDDDDATNWSGTVTWNDIAKSIATYGEATTGGGDEPFSPENADNYTIMANGVEYKVVSGVPQKFVLPVELQALFASYPDNEYGAWYGYSMAASNSPYSKTGIASLGDLADYGEKIVIVGTNTGSLNFANELPEGITGYQNTPLSTTTYHTNSTFADFKDDFVPGTWFFSVSGSASYIILYPDFCACDEPSPSEDDCTICGNLFCGKVIKGKAHTPDDSGCHIVCAVCGVVIIPQGGSGHVPSEEDCLICAECGATGLPRSCSDDEPCAYHNTCQCAKCGNCGANLEEEGCSAPDCNYGEKICKCFEMPAELLQFIEADELDYYMWRGYDNFRANPVEEYTQFGGMLDNGIGNTLGDLRKDVVIVGIKKEGFTAEQIADAVNELELADFGGKAVAYATGSGTSPAAGEALVNASPSWIILRSSQANNIFVVFNILGVSTTGSADTFALADEEQPTDGEETPGDDAVKPDTSGINHAIQEAEAIKANTAVSTDGQDVPAGTCWVTQEEMNRLEAAIAAAIAAKEAAETEEDVNEAMEALENAIAEFENARKAGKAEITGDTETNEEAVEQPAGDVDNNGETDNTATDHGEAA